MKNKFKVINIKDMNRNNLYIIIFFLFYILILLLFISFNN